MKTCPTCRQTYSDDAEFCPRDGARLATQATDRAPRYVLEGGTRSLSVAEFRANVGSGQRVQSKGPEASGDPWITSGGI